MNNLGPENKVILNVKGTKLILAFAIFVVFISLPCWAEQWALTYGGSNWYDEVYSVQQTQDGGYILAGTANSFGSGNPNVWVLKFNLDGTIAWQKVYLVNNLDDRAFSIQQTSDGGYILAGGTTSSSTYQDFLILKLNSDGTIAWQKVYGGPGYNDIAYSVQQTSDGGYIVSGITGSFGEYNWAWVLKLNSEGSISWEKSYGIRGGNQFAIFVQQTSDGGYIVLGSLAAGRSWVLRLNSDGSIAWQKSCGNCFGANSIQETSDVGYVLAGVCSDSGFAVVLKLHSDGSIAWVNAYGASVASYGAVCIRGTSDGGYIVAGTRYTKDTRSDVWLMKLNSDVSIAWQKTYGGCNYDYPRSIQQTSDGGYIVAGSTESFGAGGGDAWVLKLDANGEIPNCNAMAIGDAIVSNISVSVVSTNVLPWDTNAISYNPSISVEDTNVTPGIVCPTYAGDINLDHNVDLVDLAILASQWLQKPHCPSADIVQPPDGIVNYFDLAVFLEDWLEGTTP